MCQQWPSHCYSVREHYGGYSEHPLSVYSSWSEAIGTSGPCFSLWPTRERWAITVWIGARLNYAAVSPTRLSGVQQLLWAPGNRCSPIREEDVILCVSVLSKCVLSYCKYGVCSYISSCFPHSLSTCVNGLKATWAPGGLCEVHLPCPLWQNKSDQLVCSILLDDLWAAAASPANELCHAVPRREPLPHPWGVEQGVWRWGMWVSLL